MDNKTENITWKRIFTDYNLFYFFMMIMYAAKGNSWMQYLSTYLGNPIAMAFPIVLTILFIIKNKIHFRNKNFWSLMSIFVIWIIVVSIKFGFHPHAFYIIFQLLIAYCIVFVYKLKMFYQYEQIITFLTIIGIFVWGTNLIFPSFWNIICPYFAFDRGDSITRYNFFFASVLNTHSNNPFRNPGFSWEPGMNACLICFAIFLNLVRTQCKLKKNYNFFVLTIGLISSFSTTGYSCFLGCIIPFFLLNRQLRHSFIYILFIIPIITYVYQQDFMWNKIETLQTTDESLYIATTMETERGTYTPQRFDALAFEIMNIQEEPLTGYGLTDKDSFVKTKLSEFIYLPDGLLKLYAKYGLFLGGLITLLMLFTTIKLRDRWMCKNSWMFFLLYLIVSISYHFYETPIFIAFYFCYFWLEKGENIKSSQKGYKNPINFYSKL